MLRLVALLLMFVAYPAHADGPPPKMSGVSLRCSSPEPGHVDLCAKARNFRFSAAPYCDTIDDDLQAVFCRAYLSPATHTCSKLKDPKWLSTCKTFQRAWKAQAQKEFVAFLETHKERPPSSADCNRYDDNQYVHDVCEAYTDKKTGGCRWFEDMGSGLDDGLFDDMCAFLGKRDVDTCKDFRHWQKLGMSPDESVLLCDTWLGEDD